MRVYRVVPHDAEDPLRPSECFIYVFSPFEPAVFVAPKLEVARSWIRHCYGTLGDGLKILEMEVEFAYAWSVGFEHWCDENYKQPFVRQGRYMDYTDPPTDLVRTVTRLSQWPEHPQAEGLVPLRAVQSVRVAELAIADGKRIF